MRRSTTRRRERTRQLWGLHQVNARRVACHRAPGSSEHSGAAVNWGKLARWPRREPQEFQEGMPVIDPWTKRAGVQWRWSAAEDHQIVQCKQQKQGISRRVFGLHRARPVQPLAVACGRSSASHH